MQFGPEDIDLSTVQFTSELLQMIPAEMARKHKVIPVARTGTILIVAATAHDLNAIDDLLSIYEGQIEIRLADPKQL
jgi:hypothetical protein